MPAFLRALDSVAPALSIVFAVGCIDRPPGTPEPEAPPVSSQSHSPSPQAEGGNADVMDDAERARTKADAEAAMRVVANGGSDPTGGSFTLADATAGLSGTGALVATIKTSRGQIRCQLFEDKAPITVANFVGLARGRRPFKSGGRWVTKPAYPGTTFHRVIKGFMIQGGDPEGTGAGDPGYVIVDEIVPGAKHDHAGQICMANRGPNTNGMQFFITDNAVPRLDGKYTIFGDCTPTSVVHAIARVPRSDADRPDTPVTIDSVEVTRGD